MKPTMEMDEGAKKWMYRYVHKNYWKVAGLMEFEDFLQEGYLCYYATKDRYYDNAAKYNNTPVTSINHLMALFQRSLFSRLVDLAKKRTKFAVEISSDNEDTIYTMQTGKSATVIADAPETLQKILHQLINNPEELRKPYQIFPNGRRETFNERLCSFVGRDPTKVNLSELLKSYLHNEAVV